MDTMEMSSLSFSLEHSSPQFGQIKITIPSSYVEKLYFQASEEQQVNSHVYGFEKGNAPIHYIEKNFQPHLLEHIKEFFFKYFVINWLHREIQSQKILSAGQPRLATIVIAPHQNAVFNFSLTLAQPIPLQGWKRLIFKAPKRKNYKDLDRQVETFLKEEQDAAKLVKDNKIAPGDWINFSVSLLDKNKNALLGESKESLWLKLTYMCGVLRQSAHISNTSFTLCISHDFFTTTDTKWFHKEHKA